MRSDQQILLKPIAGKSIVPIVSVGVAFDKACRQVAAGIGQGTPSHSSQWLQGALAVLRSGADAPDGIAAATVMKPPASTARQPKTAARERKRFMRRIV
ncbi:MAG: hypothetical protein QOJ17_4436 [Rhodospirillaceae bacterium]|nr:hypothetical protein [Rhodospirillaceae bacterium]